MRDHKHESNINSEVIADREDTMMLQNPDAESDNNDIIVEHFEEKRFLEEKIVLHRLPYMKMDKKVVWRVNFICILSVFLLCAFNNYVSLLQNIIEVIAAFMAAFNIFIYPGFFFYAANKERLNNSQAGECNVC